MQNFSLKTTSLAILISLATVSCGGSSGGNEQPKTVKLPQTDTKTNITAETNTDTSKTQQPNTQNNNELTILKDKINTIENQLNSLSKQGNLSDNAQLIANLATLQAEKNQLEKEKNTLNNSINKLNEEKAKLQSDVDTLDNQLKNMNNALTEKEDSIVAFNKQISDLYNQISEKENELWTLRNKAAQVDQLSARINELLEKAYPYTETDEQRNIRLAREADLSEFIAPKRVIGTNNEMYESNITANGSRTEHTIKGGTLITNVFGQIFSSLSYNYNLEDAGHSIVLSLIGDKVEPTRADNNFVYYLYGGNPTKASQLTELQTQGSAKYIGIANKIHDNYPNNINLVNGSITLDVNFAQRSISGRIEYPEDQYNNIQSSFITLNSAEITTHTGSLEFSGQAYHNGTEQAKYSGMFMGKDAKQVSGIVKKENEFSTYKDVLAVFTAEKQ
ncbi:transferrin-binding protein-like solute binding protein [Gallibacterium salpingitidis]|uniref:factor H binding protein domain-containing protein n=1 Tax=Gallibacterium salpingitidis TaxID=505341 RepID=UPI00266F1B0C|nr:factor H binding protein domain-containing protein [Gallibacterium salpingitidis]WKS99748.1 transferrin-binding protein-like solute binding protein [Gallibacterium salpingitidis]